MASPQEEEAPHPSTAAWLRMAWSGEYGVDDRWELTCGGSVLNGEYGAAVLASAVDVAPSFLLGGCAWWSLCCHAPQPGEEVC